MVMPKYVGVDWASREHAVCVIDEHGAICQQFRVTHSGSGLTELVGRLREYGDPSALPIAIERPSGVLVDTLVAGGFAVTAIHPNVVKASRPRYRAALSKSDPHDAYVLADLLRTDGHRFARLASPSDATRALRALVRSRDDLVATRVALANQLRAVLERGWPGGGALFAAVDSPIALAFLARYPTPHHAASLTATRLAAFLRRQGYPGRRSAAELLARLHAAPVGCPGAAEHAANGAVVLALVGVLQPLVLQLQQLTATIRRAIATHPDGPIFVSFPRAGQVNAAQMLAEMGDQRARFLTEAQLAAEAGIAPVTCASGKHRGVRFRYACNKRLRQALTRWADNSRHSSPWAAAVYHRARDRGCDHPHAIRILARAWVRVLWRCWKTATPYDPVQHGGARRLPHAA
jgi:transposase